MSLAIASAAVAFAVITPLVLVALLGLVRFVVRRPAERAVAAFVEGVFFACAIAVAAGAAGLHRAGEGSIVISLGEWFHVSSHSISLTLAVDPLSLSFGALGALSLGLVARFSASYLHRERGYFRYLFLLSLLGAGVMVVAFAGSLGLVLFGWELVGVASALLIAYFHDRPTTVRHAFQAFVTYRVCDLGFLAALTWLHHTEGAANLVAAPGDRWATLGAPADALDAHLVAFGLVLAAMGKSAQFPVSGWLPRAMEGPTPSSAIFYGALSIHLGPVLLLRAAPLLEATPAAAAALVIIGALTAGYATLVGRVQPDVKGRLAYASMGQVGLIFVEIGMGLELLALVHILGHAALRSVELLRAPSAIRDRRQGRGAPKSRLWAWFDSTALGRRVYCFGLERGFVDPFVVVALRRVVAFFREVDRRDAAFIERLEREAAPEPAVWSARG